MKHSPFNFWRLALSFALLVSLSYQTLAQNPERHTSIGVHMSVLEYQGDYGSDYWKFNNQQYAPGLSINQYLSRGLDLNTQVFYGQLSGSSSANRHFTTTLINANVGLKFKLNNGWALKEEARIQPYLLAGTGWTYASRAGVADSNRIDANTSYLDVQAGAGISLRLGRGLNLFVQSSQHLPMRANIDGAPEESTPRWADRFLQHTVGLTFHLGQSPDADEDGVPDRQDKCPNTPADLEVDEHGCPFDDDQDGVPNYQDQCPDQPGLAATQGCPDTDNDGVDDTDDVCPNTPGKPELRGCPDTDNDGVVDEQDKCPDTPEGASVDANGCPTALPPASTTTEDTDGDGIPNAEDRCPDRPGPASNRGCPELQAEARQRLQEATKTIGFELGKATLLPSSFPTLDAIAQLLREYPDYSLSIAGHTDSQGPAAYNLRLSRERAAAARRYLLDRGITDSRVELRGYGPLHPLAPNMTETGRTQNRRVEFDLFLSGDPNAAQVKYGPEPATTVTTAPAKPSKAPARKAPARRPTPKKNLTPRRTTGRKAPTTRPAPLQRKATSPRW